MFNFSTTYSERVGGSACIPDFLPRYGRAMLMIRRTRYCDGDSGCSTAAQISTRAHAESSHVAVVQLPSHFVAVLHADFKTILI